MTESTFELKGSTAVMTCSCGIVKTTTAQTFVTASCCGRSFRWRVAPANPDGKILGEAKRDKAGIEVLPAQ